MAGTSIVLGPPKNDTYWSNGLLTLSIGLIVSDTYRHSKEADAAPQPEPPNVVGFDFWSSACYVDQCTANDLHEEKRFKLQVVGKTGSSTR